MMQVACGLQYLHSCQPKVVHRDVKPDNILLGSPESPFDAKLSDFGFARSKSHFATQCGTKEYLAPEVLQVRCGSRK